MKVKIIGAGSIGNHLAQASRRIGWEVTVVDTDLKSLVRMREEIYPKRYGAWDDEIKLFLAGEEPKGGFDIIMVGTPPDVRMKVAIEALKEKPRLLHLEKPLYTPDGSEFLGFQMARREHDLITKVTVGYNHAVSKSVREMVSMIEKGMIGEVLTIDVEFRECWQGILDAHPWLSEPSDSYLGHWQRGGGAAGEHSHALHLWIYLASVLSLSGWGEIFNVKAMFSIKKGSNYEYDEVAMFLLSTKFGKIGHVVQDVITYPAKKWARLQGTRGYIEWHCNGTPIGDLLRYKLQGATETEKVFVKTRQDDFYEEMLHYDDLLSERVRFCDSPLQLWYGRQVMSTIYRAFNSYGFLVTK